MEYQEIITEYKDDNLDISKLKEKMEIAKPLKGRLKYRAANRIENSIDLIFSIPNTLVISEIPEKCQQFNRSCNKILEEYHNILIKSIKETNAWEFLKISASDYSKEKFIELCSEEKFKTLLELNQKYSFFLQYQKFADIRDCLGKGVELDDKTIKKIEFLSKMLNALENSRIKTEFYMFNEKFLINLANFEKAKNVKLENYMKSKGKNVYDEYIKLSQFFSVEDFKDISENLILTSKTLNVSIPNVIQAFSEISETEMEIEYFLSEYNEINQLKSKYQKMKAIEEQNEKIVEEQIDETAETEEVQDDDEELISEDKQEEEETGEHNEIEIFEEDSEDLEEQIEEVNEEPIEKETVNYVKLFWFQREEKLEARTMTEEQLYAFLDKIKQMEEETGVRSSLFLITNSNEYITKKRFEVLQKEAEKRGMPKLLEGALGGYSSFKIELDGSIKNISRMSEVNRNKIITLMSNYGIEDSYINKDEKLYIRYEFSNENDKAITILSLNRLKSVLENRIRRSNQPIEILTFLEGSYSGMDVVLNSQMAGIAQIESYYDSKYNVLGKQGITVYTNNISEFNFHKCNEEEQEF